MSRFDPVGIVKSLGPAARLGVKTRPGFGWKNVYIKTFTFSALVSPLSSWTDSSFSPWALLVWQLLGRHRMCSRRCWLQKSWRYSPCPERKKGKKRKERIKKKNYLDQLPLCFFQQIVLQPPHPLPVLLHQLKQSIYFIYFLSCIVHFTYFKSVQVIDS